ncbi:hypothetical protein Pst134EA_020874 [Puccinia striiformis f. sp. tritici]|uniref:hypothetical protein n=1 Tax=Puccinia striiformis f. sp. tritici TaxID=168172 RepID=UPI0020073D0F|nr:hypothetical protein Pst134EA_020874 [Puccinia striiformis f. sp. tritici]KAH9456968.1 hypothetical protein Pst134EA_020874 [Puccinia striiformis f. sp. tritici]
MLDTTQVDFLQLLPQIDHWIGSAARELRGDGSQSRNTEDDGQGDHRPIAALCSILSERQVLVPQAVKKRCQSLKDPLPESLKNLYEPLLDHLAQSYPQLFIRLLVSTLLDILSAIPEEEPGKNKQADSTYYYTCAAWLFYLLLRHVIDCRKIKKTSQSIRLVCRGRDFPLDRCPASHQDPSSPGENLMDESIDIGIAAMKQRWESLVTKEEELVNEGGSTWKLVPETNWAPCPIGCLPDQTVPDLYKAFVQPS